MSHPYHTRNKNPTPTPPHDQDPPQEQLEPEPSINSNEDAQEPVDANAPAGQANQEEDPPEDSAEGEPVDLPQGDGAEVFQVLEQFGSTISSAVRDAITASAGTPVEGRSSEPKANPPTEFSGSNSS
jgi:hypothetical protein